MFHPRPVLLIEDDPNDALLLQTAFQDLQIRNPLMVLSDGSEALQYLAGDGKYGDRVLYPFPVLAILELKSARLDGYGVLRWLKNHPETKRGLPVIAHTAYPMPGTGRSVVELGAGGLLLKPLGYEVLKEQVRQLKERWIDRTTDV